MDTSTKKIIEISGRNLISCCYQRVEKSFSEYEIIIMSKGFFFLLVTNGTATITDTHHSYALANGHLLILTPSVQSSLTDKSADFSCICLYIEPDYFDTLSVGQLAYNQVSQYIGSYRLPIFTLDKEQTDYLKKTMSLFSERLDKMNLYRDGTVRHLCSFLLLQIADVVYKKNRDTSGYVKRSSEIFRNFKRLLVHHYREHHTILFYADQLNISTTYLSRIVKHITGHTVCFHISELLCADARKLLECTDNEVKEIADQLGFSDQSVFGKFFIRKTGFTPVQFRMRKEIKHSGNINVSDHRPEKSS